MVGDSGLAPFRNFEWRRCCGRFLGLKIRDYEMLKTSRLCVPHLTLGSLGSGNDRNCNILSREVVGRHFYACGLFQL
jgi:hypothetical protein